MTVVVAFLCSDGVVLASDSMLTPSVGGVNVGHHKGRKLEVLQGPQVFGYAGDQGQAARFKTMADGSYQLIGQVAHPLDYAIVLTKSLIAQFQQTAIAGSINFNTFLVFAKAGVHHCCAFEGPIQPRFLDQHHFYAALGSGKMSADPFLRFLTDVFCGGGQPKLRDAVFLAAWTVQHVIDTNPGGVAGPIRIVTFEPDGQGDYAARELPQSEIEEHQQAIESAAEALRAWRDGILSGDAAGGAPDVPAAPSPADA